jgi:hypothetical protein
MVDNGDELTYPNGKLDNDGRLANPGLTKREYIAALAMQSLITPGDINLAKESKTPTWMADLAVRMADALLKRLA